MLLGFKPQFRPKIENGSKIHTVRYFRKVQPKVGETLHMYTGLRTKYCSIITNKEILKGIQTVRITINETNDLEIIADGKNLTANERYEFAINDGFQSIAEFISYWKGKESRVGFIGNIFHWTDFKY